MQIVFCVNGDNVVAEGNNLRACRDVALREAGHLLRPADEWEIRTTAGVLLDPDGSFKPVDGQKLILSLCAGMGANLQVRSEP